MGVHVLAPRACALPFEHRPTAARVIATAQATKQAQQEATGWWEGLKQEIKEGKFNTYARVGGYVCMRAHHPARALISGGCLSACVGRAA
jgi:hypothetical protein